MHLEIDPIGVSGRCGREAIIDSQDVPPGTIVDVDDDGAFAIVERFKKEGRGCGRRP